MKEESALKCGDGSPRFSRAFALGDPVRRPGPTRPLDPLTPSQMIEAKHRWTLLYLIGLAVVLAYAALQFGGVVLQSWNYCLLGLGALALLYWLITPRRELAPSLERWLWWPVLLLPCYAVLQLIPLPLPVLQVLSPQRA